MNDDTPIMPGPEADEPTAPTEPQPPAPDEAPTSEQPDEGHDRPRRLLRSSSDRVIAGVAGGLGDYFGVDPIIFRIGFVALDPLRRPRGARVPAASRLRPDGRRSGRGPAPRRAAFRRTGFWRAVGLVVIGIARGRRALRPRRWRGRSRSPSAGAFPSAIVIIVIGALLALAAFPGRGPLADPPGRRAGHRRRRRSRRDLDFRGGIGEREYNPTLGRVDSRGRLPAGRRPARRRPARPRLAARTASSISRRSTRRRPGERIRAQAGLRRWRPTHVGAGESEVAGERNDGVDVEPHRRHRRVGHAAPRDRRERRHRPAPSDQQRHRGHRQRRLRPRAIPRGHGAAARGGGEGVRREMKVDLVSLASGAVIAALGALVLLDSSGATRPLPRLDGGRADRGGRRDLHAQRARSAAAERHDRRVSADAGQSHCAATPGTGRRRGARGAGRRGSESTRVVLRVAFVIAAIATGGLAAARLPGRLGGAPGGGGRLGAGRLGSAGCHGSAATGAWRSAPGC